jgi:opacity protein-like surface antigen
MNGRGNGSLKDRGANGVPVPAPVPYEEHYKFYIGGGIGYTFRSSGDIGLTAGGVTGQLGYGGYGDLEGPWVFSVVAGRYLTPTLRTEIGLDMRSAQKHSRTQTYQAQLSSQMDFGVPGTPDMRTVTNTYDVSRTDEMRLRNNTLMLNLYYDMNRGGRFNPYVGAGIGIAHVNFSRTATETAVCASGSNDPITGLPPAACWAGATPLLPTGIAGPMGRTDAEVGISVAASLMAGFTYNISDRTHLDVGYRLMYQGAKAAVVAPSLGPCTAGCSATGISVMDIGARIDHEIRTGIRWDLW